MWGIRALLFLAIGSSVCAQSHTIESNLRYRLARFDLESLGQISPAPPESKRAIKIKNGDQLLRICRDHAEHWQQDPLIFRFGHSRPGSSIGCREKSSPSVHAVFYKLPGGVREAWVHFDLHGPHNLAGHVGEVLRNRMTFGRTSEYDVYRSLVRANPVNGEILPPARYDMAAHTKEYLRRAFGYRTIGSAAASAAAATLLQDLAGIGNGSGSYRDRVYTNVARNAISQSIEFGAAAFLGQDQSFYASGEQGFGRRARAALHRSFFVPGREGNELAFPRIAAAMGTPWVMHAWYPGPRPQPDPWVQSALMMGRYVARSYWAEFKPDIRRALQKLSPRKKPKRTAAVSADAN